jgi:predicted dehydrogenase
MSINRIYIVGAGVISKSHVKALMKMSESKMIKLSVADPNQLALDSFLEQFPHVQSFTSMKEMLAEPAASNDIVIVATPPFTHYELSLEALQSGRHVLCEKPLAMNRDEAVRLLEAANRMNKHIGCCSTRFLDIVTNNKVKRMLEEGLLGRVYQLKFINRKHRSRTGIEYQPSTRWFLDRSKSGGGTVMDWGPYDIACLNDLLKPVRVDVLHAWMENPETFLPFGNEVIFDTEQHAGAAIVFHLKDGSKVNVTYERAACTHGDEQSIVELEGTRGSVRWDWLCLKESAEVVYTIDQDGQAVKQKFSFPVDKNINPFDKPILFFYNALHGQDSRALMDEDAVFNFSCLRAIYECAESDQPITVERRRA